MRSKQGTKLELSIRESGKRELEPGGRGIAIDGAVTRKHVVTD
jgi:hypothetical protein